MGMRWFGGVIPSCQSQERTRDVYDYRVQLEQDQSVRRMELPLDAYNTEASAAVGAWVLLEPNKKRQTEGTTAAEGGGHNSRLGDTQAGVARFAVSSKRGTITPNVRNVNLVA